MSPFENLRSRKPRRAARLASWLRWLPVLLLTGAARGAAAERPNIVMFMTDDQAWSAMGAYGNPILKTPNMDRIAAGGILFERAFVVNSLCAPSRASFLTGRYGHATGVTTNAGEPKVPQEHYSDEYIVDLSNSAGLPVMPRGEITFPEILQAHGYCTAFVGKTHLAPHNRDRGYDYYFGFKGQGRYRNPILAEHFGGDAPYEDKEYPGHLTDLLGDHAVKFLETVRDRTKPFCLLLWFKAPHANWDAPDRFKQALAGVTFPKPDTWDYDLSRKPAAVADTHMQIGKADQTVDYDSYLRNYYQCLLGVDDNVGKVLDALDRQGLAGNTAVIYTSDNGMFLGEFGMLDKRLMYEPSIRIPLLVRHPQRIRPGARTARMALNLDLAPTVLELAGVAAPGNLHGRSLVPLFAGDGSGWRTEWLYEYYEYPWWHRVRPFRGIRTDRHKLIHWYSTSPEQFELYDLAADPQELNDLAQDPASAALIRRLYERMQALRRETGDPDLGLN